MYDTENMLELSGIQHFVFCKRQWALITIEQQWVENYYTVSGNIMHERVHDGEHDTTSRGIITSRGVHVCSRVLGITGICDAVEYSPCEDGIAINGLPDKYCICPIEYKRGEAKEHDADELQLTAQAICLEEMLVCCIPFGYLYYGRTRRRVKVEFSDELRMRVKEMTEKMHDLYNRKHTPSARKTKQCMSCSLYDVCMPRILENKNVGKYIERVVKEL